MKLERKKNLISRTLKIGKGRVVLNNSRLSELKEAITRQDIRDLLSSGAISISEIHGRLKNNKRRTRRRIGSIKKKVKGGKTRYVNLTRKLRSFLKGQKTHGKISSEAFWKVRSQIRASEFRSLAHMKERIKEQNLIISEVKNENSKEKKIKKKNWL